MNSKSVLYLASASPRRRELLAQIEPNFELLKVNVEEIKAANETANDYVQRLAREKALAGVSKVLSNAIVLGADTIVVQGEKVFEKPIDEQDAKQMMMQLSNAEHQVLTAICVASQTGEKTIVVSTDVTFCSISEKQIQAYWQTGEPADKAGAYGIQGLGGQFVSKINGSYSSVVGLPLVETRHLLSTFRLTHVC